MQALKKAERAKQEQTESLKQLEESNLKEAETATAPVAMELSVPAEPSQPVEPTPPAAGAPAPAEPILDFPSLEMALDEPEPPPPPAKTEVASPPPETSSGEPLLALDMQTLDAASSIEDGGREEPKLELSFAEIPEPTAKPTEPPVEVLLLTPDESLLSIEPAPESPPSPPPQAPVPPPPRESPPPLSLDLPSILESAPPPPPPIMLSETPEPLVLPPLAKEPAKPIEEPASPPVVPPPPMQPAPEQKKEDPVKEKPAPGGTDTSKPAQQQIAKTVFAAKQAVRNPRKLIYGVVAGVLLGIVSGGAYYVWQETMMVSPPVFVPPPAPEVPNAQQGDAVPQDAVPAAPTGEAAPVPVPPSPAARQAQLPESASVSTATSQQATPEAAKAPPVPKEGEAPAAKPAVTRDTPDKQEAKRPEPVAQEVIPATPGIKIVRGNSAPTANPLLSKAYQALLSGDMEQAQQHYQQVLRHDARNRDAMQGMAVIAIQRQHLTQAAAIYTRMLENDPNDAEALSGLTALQGMSDPIQHESRLKNLLAKNPNASAAHFALGNLYSRQSRWSDAQGEFFRAYSGNPDNPDYTYNLAVSLDQLGQAKLALDYYQRALAMTKGNNVAFDRAAVQTRIRDLAPQPGEDTK